MDLILVRFSMVQHSLFGRRCGHVVVVGIIILGHGCERVGVCCTKALEGKKTLVFAGASTIQ
jgi:hypothetical protein